MRNRIRARPLLGTLVEIGVCCDDVDADSAINYAFDSVATIHSLMSFQDPKSDLSRLNAADGEVELHQYTAEVLRRALRLGRSSNELFNCTVAGALVRAGALPDHGGNEPLAVGKSCDVRLVGRKALRLRPVRISLDGIAKGYAVDLAVSALRRVGVTSGWVNAGGDVRAFGDSCLQIRRRNHDGSFADLGTLREAALATSSVFPAPDPDYPASMFGARCGSANEGTWSVSAPEAWLADALTKVASLAEPPTCSEVVERLGGTLVQPA